MRVYLLVLVICIGALCLDVAAHAQASVQHQDVLVAAAKGLQSRVREVKVVFDTTAFDSERSSRAIAAVTGWLPGNRANVLHCLPPICDLVDADGLVILNTPSFQPDGTASVLIQVWTPGSGTRGATMTAYRVELSRTGRCNDRCYGGWTVSNVTVRAIS